MQVCEPRSNRGPRDAPAHPSPHPRPRPTAPTGSRPSLPPPFLHSQRPQGNSGQRLPTKPLWVNGSYTLQTASWKAAEKNKLSWPRGAQPSESSGKNKSNEPLKYHLRRNNLRKVYPMKPTFKHQPQFHHLPPHPRVESKGIQLCRSALPITLIQTCAHSHVLPSNTVKQTAPSLPLQNHLEA